MLRGGNGEEYYKTISIFADNNKIILTDSIKSNNEMMKRDMYYLWSGVIGAFIMALIICLFLFIRPGFRYGRYYVYEDPSLLTLLLSATDLSPLDSITVSQAIHDEANERKDAIEDLIDQKMIISSGEFASNITSYYNALIAVLASIFILLNLVGYFSWRSNANSSLEQKQRELDDALSHLDERLERNLEDLLRKNIPIKEKIESFVRELLEQRETLDEEEWDKLHLLLKMYKREENLRAIKDDDSEINDGEIQ